MFYRQASSIVLGQRLQSSEAVLSLSLSLSLALSLSLSVSIRDRSVSWRRRRFLLRSWSLRCGFESISVSLLLELFVGLRLRVSASPCPPPVGVRRFCPTAFGRAGTPVCRARTT